VSASIYLSIENQRTLDKELRETYGESLEDLRHKQSNSRSATITLREVKIPPLVIQQLVRTVIRKERPVGAALTLKKPATDASPKLERPHLRYCATVRHEPLLPSQCTRQ
jgi:hypothetical protein